MKFFYLRNCPYCKNAITWMKELLNENVLYQEIPVEWIEESEQSELADTYDYYYVPCFFVGNEKVHEGIISKEDIQKIFDEYLRRREK